MKSSSWPEALIATTAIVSSAAVICVIARQIGRVISDGMLFGLSDRSRPAA